MNIEQEYYENDHFWSGLLKNAADQDRIKTTAELVPDGVETLLDIGCGDGIFVNYLKDVSGRSFRRLNGADRSAAALRYVRTEKTIGSIESLPFKNREFDLVSALEVIEHLPIKTFDAGLDSISRIARQYIIISVPYSEDLKNSLIPCPKCNTRFHPDYHMSSFDDNRMEALFVGKGFKMTKIVHIGASEKYRVIHRLKNQPSRVEYRFNPFRVPIPCPVCGYYLPARNSEKTIRRSRKRLKRLREIVKKLWPKETVYRWVAARYERMDVGS